MSATIFESHFRDGHTFLLGAALQVNDKVLVLNYPKIGINSAKNSVTYGAQRHVTFDNFTKQFDPVASIKIDETFTIQANKLINGEHPIRASLAFNLAPSAGNRCLTHH